MPKKDDDELVIPTELLEKDPTELANNEEELIDDNNTEEKENQT